jgi:hypothetical protein
MRILSAGSFKIQLRRWKDAPEVSDHPTRDPATVRDVESHEPRTGDRTKAELD